MWLSTLRGDGGKKWVPPMNRMVPTNELPTTTPKDDGKVWIEVKIGTDMIQIWRAVSPGFEVKDD